MTKQDERFAECFFSLEDYEDLQQNENMGFCLACGEFQDRRLLHLYECECCGEREVYGLEECLLMGHVL